MIVDWPGNIIPVAQGVPYLEQNAASGGRSLSGTERIIITNAGRWRWSVRLFLGTVEQVRAWRGVMALVQGRGNPIMVPYFDQTTDLAAVNGERAARTSITAGIMYTESGDNVTHDDGTLLSDTVMPARATLTKGAGQSVVRLQFSSGLSCDPGDFFSTARRMYQVRDVQNVTGNVYDLTISPPLREKLLVNQEVSFDRILCQMRLEDDSAAAAMQDPAFMGDISLDFVEDFA